MKMSIVLADNFYNFKIEAIMQSIPKAVSDIFCAFFSIIIPNISPGIRPNSTETANIIQKFRLMLFADMLNFTLPPLLGGGCGVL